MIEPTGWNDIQDNPFYVTVLPGPVNATASDLVIPWGKTYLGAPFMFTLTLRDRCGNEPMTGFATPTWAMRRIPDEYDDDRKIELEIFDFGNGYYEAYGIADKVGSYELIVGFADVSVVNVIPMGHTSFPFTGSNLDFIGLSTKHSEVKLTSSYIAGEASTVTITARDHNGDRIRSSDNETLSIGIWREGLCPTYLQCISYGYSPETCPELCRWEEPSKCVASCTNQVMSSIAPITLIPPQDGVYNFEFITDRADEFKGTVMALRRGGLREVLFTTDDYMRA